MIDLNWKQLRADGAIGEKYLVWGYADEAVEVGGTAVEGKFRAVIHLSRGTDDICRILKGSVEAMKRSDTAAGREGTWITPQAQTWARHHVWPAYGSGSYPSKLHCYGGWNPVAAGILLEGEVALPLFRMSGTEWLIVKGQVKGINA